MIAIRAYFAALAPVEAVALGVAVVIAIGFAVEARWRLIEKWQLKRWQSWK